MVAVQPRARWKRPAVASSSVPPLRVVREPERMPDPPPESRSISGMLEFVRRYLSLADMPAASVCLTRALMATSSMYSSETERREVLRITEALASRNIDLGAVDAAAELSRAAAAWDAARSRFESRSRSAEARNRVTIVDVSRSAAAPLEVLEEHELTGVIEIKSDDTMSDGVSKADEVTVVGRPLFVSGEIC